jgi:hypothetical protein
VHPGELIFHFLNTIIVTAFVAVFVLWRYRISVLAGMGMHGTAELALEEAPAAAWREPAPALRDLEVWERGVHRRVATATFLAVGICAAPLGALWLLTGGGDLTPLNLFIQTGGFLLAAVPMIAVSTALSPRRTLWLGVRVLAVCAIATVIVSMLQRLFTGRLPSWDQLLNAWVFVEFTGVQMSIPLLLMLATGAPQIRGVAPITFVGLFVFGLSPLLGSRLTALLATTRSGTDVVLQLGMNAAFIALALPTAWLAWRRLRAVAADYETKRLSDVELLARVWWLMICAAAAVEIVNYSGRWIAPLVGAAFSYLAFRWLYPWLITTLGQPAPRPPTRTLLLLRVFGYARRTQRLFDRIVARWRLFGPITVIAAPDLVARTVDPGDFLYFVAGHLNASFVTSAEGLESRLAAIDAAPDRNGRYRVNEFCCQDQTWRATVVALMHRADVVFMDLRGVTAERRGCEFELQQLAARVDPRRMVLIVDERQDSPRDFIGRIIGPAIASSRTFTLSGTRDAHTDRVLDTLLDAAYGTVVEAERADPNSRG